MKQKKHKSKFRRWLRKLFWTLFIVFLALSIAPVVIYKYLPVYYTPLMAIRYFEYKKQDKPVKTRKDWVSMDKISLNFQLAAIAAEDDRFIEHGGFDLKAIEKAWKANKKKSKTMRGGSTISQQTAKNVFLWPDRSWIRKGLETYFTFMIEGIWGKKRIMEVYLNVVETGKGIYGVEAASLFYFKKHASEVNKYEAAAIISVLPNPRKFSVLRPSPMIKRYRSAIVVRMSKMEQELFSEK